MSFILGLDVGTASGAGATKRGGRVQPCALGDRTATLPAVVVLHEDGTTLVGEEAERIAGLELTRIARDLRLDPSLQTSSIVVGGQVHSPYELLRTLYSTMAERVCLSHNATPSHLVLTHPPLPEGVRCEMVDRIADELFPGALVVPEPIAATVKLACDGAIPADCIVTVYDFGGGSFDATLVRREGDRFSVVGDPSGLPSFGGIDIDDLVLDYVNRSIDGGITRLDLSDPEAMAALTRLRAECRDAKERLSYETDVAIDASLPNAPALVELSRQDFEDILLPNLESTVDVVEQMIADAGLHPSEVNSIALVGGSSRIPLVVELLTARTNIPVLVDPYPELTVALGAAQMVDDETPSSSVFPFAELALPSLTALSGAVMGGVAGSGGGGPEVGAATALGEAVGDLARSPGRNAGAAVGALSDDTEFDTLLQRGRDMTGRPKRHPRGGNGKPRPKGPGDWMSGLMEKGLSPKVGIAVVGGVVAALVLATAAIGGLGSNDEPDTTAGAEGGPTTTASTTSTSTPSSTSSQTTGSTEGAAASPSSSTTSTTRRPTTTTTARPGSPPPPPPPPPPPTDPPPPDPTTTTTTSTSTSSSTSTTSTTLTSQPAGSTLRPTYTSDDGSG